MMRLKLVSGLLMIGVFAAAAGAPAQGLHKGAGASRNTPSTGPHPSSWPGASGE